LAALSVILVTGTAFGNAHADIVNVTQCEPVEPTPIPNCVNLNVEKVTADKKISGKISKILDNDIKTSIKTKKSNTDFNVFLADKNTTITNFVITAKADKKGSDIVVAEKDYDLPKKKTTTLNITTDVIATDSFNFEVDKKKVKIYEVDLYGYVGSPPPPPANQPPTTNNQAVSTVVNKTLSFTLNADDEKISSLTYNVTENTKNGTLALLQEKATYIPDSNFIGTDSFSYKVNDGEFDSNIATVSITVNNATIPPLECPDGFHIENGVCVPDVVNPPDNTTWTIAFMADLYKITKQMCQKIADENPEVVIYSGDYYPDKTSSFGSDCGILLQNANIKMPIALGNHEAGKSPSQLQAVGFDNNNKLVFGATHKNLLYMILDTEHWDNVKVAELIDDDGNTAKINNMWAVVATHKPLFAPQGIGKDNDHQSFDDGKAALINIDRQDVELAVSGHTHNYLRSVPMDCSDVDVCTPSVNGTTYLVVGNANGDRMDSINLNNVPSHLKPLIAETSTEEGYTVCQVGVSEMACKMKNLNGQVLDEFTLTNNS